MDPIQRLAGRFQALSDPTRLELLAFIEAGEPSATECIRHLRQSQPRVARHLRILVEAGLVQARRNGRFVHYAVSRDGGAPAILAAAALAALTGVAPRAGQPESRAPGGPEAAPPSGIPPIRPAPAHPGDPAPTFTRLSPAPPPADPEEPPRRPLEDFLL